jgi:AraC-like DNA-binding protein
MAKLVVYGLLRTSKDSVARVAEVCGYSTEASFRKAFVQYAGIAPWAVMKKTGPGFWRQLSAASQRIFLILLSTLFRL